jgi:NCS2 family nucleobase:cation symporter-2
MTLFSGVFESCIAPFLNRLRGIFPPEVSGLVIFMIGWSAGIAGLRMLLGAGAPPVDQVEWSIAALTLVVMTVCNIWGTGIVRMTSALIGIVVGYILAALFGFIDGAPIFARDERFMGRPSAVSCVLVLRSIIDRTVCYREPCSGDEGGWDHYNLSAHQRSNWVRPDLRSVTRGVLADGLTPRQQVLPARSGTNTSTPGWVVAAASGVT